MPWNRGARRKALPVGQVSPVDHGPDLAKSLAGLHHCELMDIANVPGTFQMEKTQDPMASRTWREGGNPKSP